MKRRFISALLFGALLIAPSSTFVGCSDYDDDIASLQEQINTGATNLDDLVKDKVSNMEKEIAALKATQGDLEKALEDATKNLEEAYKAADGDIVAAYKAADAEMYKQSVEAAQKLVDDALKSMEDALAQANARIDACEAADATLSEKIENLLAADATMTVAIQKAQADAEKAYQLAEQAKATADNAMAQAEANAGKIADLESEYKALAEDLKSQAETLSTVSKDLDSVNQALKKEISALSEKVEKLSGELASQNASLTAQIGALEEKLNQLMGQETGESEVPNLKKEIEDLTTALGKLQQKVTGNEKALASIIDAQIKTVTDGLDSRLGALENKLKDKEILQRADIKSIIEEYLKAEGGVSEKLSTLSTDVSKNATAITTLSKRVDAINGLVQALYTDLSNLITGLIVQDATSDFQAVYGQMTEFEDHPNNGKTYFESAPNRTLYFPYKGATRGDASMKKGQYNVEKNAGTLYVTINPNTVDFEGQSLSLVNSKDQANTEYELLPATKANNKLISRAASNSGNGLYAFAIQNNFNASGNVFNAPKTNDRAKYAVAASYEVSDNEGAVDEETNLPTDKKTRKVYSRYEIELNAVPAVPHTDSDISLTGDEHASYNANRNEYLFSSLSGKLQMNVATVSNSDKVYAKYVECVKAVNSNDVESADAKAAANNQKNAPGIQEVLFEDNEHFKDITVTIPEEYNGYTFTFDYYVWNYDGSIARVQKSFTFHKPLIEEDGALSLSHTPTSFELNVATQFSGKQFSELNSMDAQRSLWESETKTVDIISGQSGIEKIEFLNAQGQLVMPVTLSGGDASNVNLTSDQLRTIKNISVSYKPANLALGTTYPIKFTFKNGRNNTVSVVVVNFTMNRPTSPVVEFIPASIVEGTDNKFIAWAQLDNPSTPTCAQFNFIHNAVNPRFNSTSGTRQKFHDMADYTVNSDYQPAKQDIYETATDALMKVPFKAVQDEHMYNINAGVEFFGVASLWKGDTPMELQWKSPVKHAVKDHLNGLPNSLHVNINYPGTQELTSLTAVDPSKPSTTVQILGNTVDSRIASIEFDDASNPQNANYGLIEKHQVLSNGSGYKLMFKTVNAGDGSIQSSADLVYNVKVTDKFGCTQNFVVTVTVKPNLQPSSAPRK